MLLKSKDAKDIVKIHRFIPRLGVERVKSVDLLIMTNPLLPARVKRNIKKIAFRSDLSIVLNDKETLEISGNSEQTILDAIRILTPHPIDHRLMDMKLLLEELEHLTDALIEASRRRANSVQQIGHTIYYVIKDPKYLGYYAITVGNQIVLRINLGESNRPFPYDYCKNASQTTLERAIREYPNPN